MKSNMDNILNNCLERIKHGESIEECLKDYPEHAAELEPLLRIAGSTADRARQIQADSSFKLKAKNQMMSRTRDNPTRIDKVQKLTLKYKWAFPALVLLFLLIFSGVVIGANDAMPGEPLYSLKTTMEKINLKLTPSEVDKANLRIKFAERRAKEILNKSKNSGQVQKLSQKIQKELDAVISIANDVSTEKNGENKVAKIVKRLQNSDELNSEENLYSGPMDTVKIAAENALLELTTSDVSEAKLRIEFAEQRVNKAIKVSSSDNYGQVDTLLQSVTQHLGHLDTLAQNLTQNDSSEDDLTEITSMLRSASDRNADVYNHRWERATEETRHVLEQAFNRAREQYDDEINSLNTIRENVRNRGGYHNP